MITTAKTTRGMIITILNFDKYQNPSNYEQHSEQHDETPTNNTVATHDTEEGEEKKKEEVRKEQEYSASSDAANENAEDDFAVYLTKKKRKLTGKRLHSFERFWIAFDYKRGKAEAADAWLDIPQLTNALVEQICSAASCEAAKRPQVVTTGKTPKMAQGWISGRRWEDDLAEVGPNTGNAQTDQNIMVASSWAQRRKQAV